MSDPMHSDDYTRMSQAINDALQPIRESQDKVERVLAGDWEEGTPGLVADVRQMKEESREAKEARARWSKRAWGFVSANALLVIGAIGAAFHALTSLGKH